MRSTYEKLILEVRIGPDILQRQYSRFGCLATKIWIKSTWEGVIAHGVRVTIQDYGQLPLRQINDKYLIQLFSEAEYTNSEPTILNWVRLYL